MYSSDIYIMRILLTICTIGATISTTTAYVPCDKNKQCKYGGRCWEGKCHCVFNCSPTNWYSSRSERLCAPKHIQSRPFLNLCQLTAKACEMQQPIPIVKMDYSVPKKLRCRVKSDWELCDKPGDFMGTCGGNLGRYGNKNAGVCLKQRSTNTTRCQCPNTMSGRDCQAKVLPQMSVRKDADKLEGGEHSASNIAVQLTYSLCAVVVAIVIVILIAKWYANGQLNIYNNKKEKIICKEAECYNNNHSNNNRDGDVTITILNHSSPDEAMERNNNTETPKKNYLRKFEYDRRRSEGVQPECFAQNPLEIIVTSPSPTNESVPIL